MHQLLDYLLTDNNGYQSLLFYFGAPVIILALIGVVLGWRNSWVQFFTGLTIFTSIMALKPTIIHSFVFAVLPRFEELHSHVPSRILAVQWIGPTMLAATAINELMLSPSRKAILRAAVFSLLVWGLGIMILRADNLGVAALTVICALLTVGIVGLFSIVNTPPVERYSRFIPRAQAGLAGLLILLVLTDPSGGRLITTLRTGQTMSEVIRIPTGPVDKSVATINDATTDPGGAGEFLQALQANGEYVRFFGYDDVLQEGGEGYLTTYRENFANPTALSILVNARAMRLHIFDVQGYNPVQLKNYVLYLQELNGTEQNYHDAQILPTGLTSPLLNILNAKYIVIPQSAVTGRPRQDVLQLLARYPMVFQNSQVRVLENTDAMPRAWIAHNIVEMDTTAMAAAINATGFDPATTVLVPTGSPSIQASDPGKCKANPRRLRITRMIRSH